MNEVMRNLPLMGGTVETVLYDVDEVFADELFVQVYEEGLRLQKVFNFFDPESELSQLNTLRSLKVSDEFRHVLEAALRYAALSGGVYDVSRGLLFRARKQGQALPSVGCSYKDIVIHGESVDLVHPDVLIDLGSIAKGYIADRMLEFMQSLGIYGGFIDARGDMRIYGTHVEVVDVQNPRDGGEYLGPVVLDNLAIATSGDYMQYYGSYDENHIVGSRDVISVTVLADTLMDADAIATCVFLLGKEFGMDFMKNVQHHGVLVIDKNFDVEMDSVFKLHLLEVRDGT